MIRTDNSFIQRNSTLVQHFDGYEAILNLNMAGITTNPKELLVTFQFVNGNTATISILNFNLFSVYRGFIEFPEIKLPDNGGDTNGITTPGNTTTVAAEQPFIPSGFGVKQIGIADYNKVEQSIQGYVEGEVAHIENIMAREFKEKSTRRLRRSEVTESLTSETERENLTDTSSVERFEMQNEIARVIASSKDFSAATGVQFKPNEQLIFNANASFAAHSSREESNRQAVTNSKEITERALDRVVNKVKQERIEKILEEFEENNSHGFDNRKGDRHVVGVYRWVDKIYKNQVVNYGKRLMFEFMVPEPARLHKLALEDLAGAKKATTIPKPQDPRTAITYKLADYSMLTDQVLKYWTGIYNVEFAQKPLQNIEVTKSFEARDPHHTGGDDGKIQTAIGKGEIEIPENYIATTAHYFFGTYPHNFRGAHQGYISVGGKESLWIVNRISTSKSGTLTDFNVQGKLEYSYLTGESPLIIGSIRVRCTLTNNHLEKWQQDTFNAIIKAYEEALQKYNEQIAQETANGVKILGTNPGFYREIENSILRKNCISYLINTNPDAKKTFGKDFYRKNNNDTTLHFGNAMISQTKDLDEYASFVKFMEQAFEWDIMSYYFYPYYWGNRSNWVEMYQYDQTHDPVFKAFMQSGMARVIVTVRPGFEEAVRYYMQTGQIWQGGEVPVIGDPLYLSIVDEMRRTEGKKIGKAWATRVPTSLTILQAESIGLRVEKALPYDEDLSDFENPAEVPQSSQLEITGAQVGIPAGQGARTIENIDINNGYLQLTTDDSPRQVVAQISVQALKNAIDEATNP
ncbi:hypothetical protein CHU92_01470 [Flavobacterium cyanobacteriorum]|uniref:Uncharacterized protein n=2 Tax=Flavobacterium cyanobacteriorum TaxID=2022802 RepID=A0A256A011_9FLAO|nr:hypothetical protein CHU92_01470 [Flavobacterium cyanobacteriorum]